MLSRSAGSEQADESVELGFLMQHQMQPLLQRAWIMLEIERVAPHPGDSDYGVLFCCMHRTARVQRHYNKIQIQQQTHTGTLFETHHAQPAFKSVCLSISLVCLNTFKKCQPSFLFEVPSFQAVIIPTLSLVYIPCLSSCRKHKLDPSYTKLDCCLEFQLLQA